MIDLDVQVRLATADDVSTINAIQHLCWKSHGDIVSLENVRTIVGIRNGAVAGWASCSDSWGRDRTFLLGVAVHPEFRRQKVATVMMEAIQAAALIDGRRIAAIVNLANQPAIRFFESIGFFCSMVGSGPICNLSWGRSRAPLV